VESLFDYELQVNAFLYTSPTASISTKLAQMSSNAWRDRQSHFDCHVQL